MKIACVATSRIPSFTANSIQVMKACQGLAQNGHETALWIPAGGQSDWPELAAHYGLSQPFEIKRLTSNRMLKRYDLAVKAMHQARSWQADLIYTWLPQAAVLGLIQKIPVVLEMHDLPTGNVGPQLFRQFIRLGGKKRLLCITQALLEKLEKTYDFKLREDQVQIAPNGTEPERYKDLPTAAEARELLGLKQGFTVGYTGHFYAGRGMELILDMIPRFPEINFLFVGGQPEKVLNWQALIKNADLHNTHSTGFIENSGCLFIRLRRMCS